MLKPIETERLILRPFTKADTQFLISLLNSPGWLKYIGDRHVHTRDEAENYIEQRLEKSYQQHGHGLFLAHHKILNVPIGSCGILKREGLNIPDLGFAFLQEFEGKGYAFEAADTMLHFASQNLLLSEICAITLHENIRSINLLKKLGFKFAQTIFLNEDPEPLDLFKKSLLY